MEQSLGPRRIEFDFPHINYINLQFCKVWYEYPTPYLPVFRIKCITLVRKNANSFELAFLIHESEFLRFADFQRFEFNFDGQCVD